MARSYTAGEGNVFTNPYGKADTFFKKNGDSESRGVQGAMGWLDMVKASARGGNLTKAEDQLSKMNRDLLRFIANENPSASEEKAINESMRIATELVNTTTEDVNNIDKAINSSSGFKMGYTTPFSQISGVQGVDGKEFAKQIVKMPDVLNSNGWTKVLEKQGYPKSDTFFKSVKLPDGKYANVVMTLNKMTNEVRMDFGSDGAGARNFIFVEDKPFSVKSDYMPKIESAMRRAEKEDREKAEDIIKDGPLGT